jgi:deferrochelatase/peroxidase EfeB
MIAMTKKYFEPIQLPLPNPVFGSLHQNGITDPKWSVSRPDDDRFEALEAHLLLEQEEGRIGRLQESVSVEDLKVKYDSEYAGRVAGQKFMTLMRADVLAEDRADLINVLKLITRFATDQMIKLPSQSHVKIFENIPESYRVTVTLGLGASLFTDKTGFDRFGLSAKKPKFLKPMPAFPGDAEGFDPAKTATDLVILIATDHPYINVAVLRYFAEHSNKIFGKEFRDGPPQRDVLKFYNVEEGFTRKDKREFLRFDDGIDNIHTGPDDLDRIVYVAESDNEPRWCTGGTYMVYRKIRQDMPSWEMLKKSVQEGMIGRDKDTGLPLSRAKAGDDQMTPVFPDPTDSADGPLDSHVRKVQPRRPDPDLFGINDLERRFLRRPYPFFEGLAEDGNSKNGLQFIAFMKSIQQQFEHVTNMWQMNPSFPIADTGIDALYAHQILSTVDGGYYFCPPGLTDENDFLGSGMFV